MASEKILNQKKEEVSKLAEQMKEAKLILLTDYRGINVTDDTTLRRDLRSAGAKYNIIKNNITKRALAECGIEGLEEKLEGPTAVVMSTEDYLEPSKIIYKFSKDNEYYKIKGGVIDGKVMTAEEIVTLAKLPSRETLLSMLAGALLGNISKIAVALDQVRIQKEEAGEKVTVSVPAEEPAVVEESATTEAENTEEA
ncbi:MAG: 50S ribosomal protein L10 [Clostridia bacterium]|nr:50S ribosomal protein L10 [Clostridia bacterium]